MQLLPEEENLSLLKAPQIYLTNLRVVQDGSNYGSINLKDITLIKTEFHANYTPLVYGTILMLISISFGEPYFYYGIAIFVLLLIYVASNRYSTLNIHAPGSGHIEARVNYVDKKTIRDFIYKIETQMEVVKVKNPKALQAYA